MDLVLHFQHVQCILSSYYIAGSIVLRYIPQSSIPVFSIILAHLSRVPQYYETLVLVNIPLLVLALTSSNIQVGGCFQRSQGFLLLC